MIESRLTVSFHEVLLVGFGAGRPGARPRAAVLLVVVGARVVRVLGAGAVVPLLLLAVLGLGEASAQPERGRGRAVPVIVRGQVLALPLILSVVPVFPGELRVVADADAQIQRLVLEHDSSGLSRDSTLFLLLLLFPNPFDRSSPRATLPGHLVRHLVILSRNVCYPALSEATTTVLRHCTCRRDSPCPSNRTSNLGSCRLLARCLSSLLSRPMKDAASHFRLIEGPTIYLYRRAGVERDCRNERTISRGKNGRRRILARKQARIFQRRFESRSLFREVRVRVSDDSTRSLALALSPLAKRSPTR